MDLNNFFQNQNIKKFWINNEWWFEIDYVLQTLTKKSLKKLIDEDPEIKKLYNKDISKNSLINLKGIFRLIQSIKNKKTEPFKLWMAILASKKIYELEKK
ncbi:hypothetical protein KO361_05865 [Candidatus Woesearchaeota archaeon]|nr:hypothetical protein [Candidatus Woesearchaeota archaeon]